MSWEMVSVSAEPVRKKLRMKALPIGKGVQFLLDEAYKIIGNPMALFYTGTGYGLIAYTDVPVVGSIWKELTETHTFSAKTQRFFMQESFTDIVANSDGLAILTSDRLRYGGALRHIFNGNGIKVANIWMVNYNQPFDTDILDAFEVLANLIMEEIRDDESYIDFGEAYQTEWIGKLIDASIESRSLHSSHVQNLYHGFKRNLYLAVVDISQCSGQYNSYRCFIDSLRRRRGDCKYALYDGRIIMLISTNYSSFSIKRELKDLESCFRDENVFAGVSGCFENLFDLRTYYLEAIEALEGLAPGSDLHVALYRRPAC